MDRLKRKQMIITAIKESKGLLTLAAKKAGIKYWTVWKYSQDFPDVKKAVNEAKEEILDFTEGKLYEQINQGNIAAIIFFLKTKGKGRGFIERSEITGAEGEPLLHVSVMSNQTKQDISDVLSRFSAN